MADTQLTSTPDVSAQIAAHADLAIQIYCSQIAADYLKFIKTHVIKDVPGCEDVNMRELMVLLLIDATAHKMMKSHEVATVLRVDAATISRGVYGLIAKEYLSAEDDLYDSRSRVFTLTEKSQTFLKDYRARCIEAIKEANARLGVAQEDHDAIVQTGYEVLYRAKDRAAAFKTVKFKSRQRFRPGQGRARPAQTPSDDHLYVYADYVFRIFADQISTDYLVFIKKNIIKEMNKFRKLALREIRILMAIDFYMKPVVATDIAAVMRLEPATVSRAVSVLLDLGLLQTSENPHDGRSKLLSLTQAGLEYSAKYKTLSQEKIEAAEEHLGFHWDTSTRLSALAALETLKARSGALAGLRRKRIRRRPAHIPRPETHTAEGDFQTMSDGHPIIPLYQRRRDR